MATVLQGQKQLLEKFWRGACRAVTTPRPESVIIASIAARRALSSSSALMPKCGETSLQPAEPPEPEPEPEPELEIKSMQRKRHTKCSRTRKHHSRHRSRSVSSDGEFSPRPMSKSKKKKKKSERKRRRERSSSASVSPVRKKKKKKKSSKKRKQHRSASKKRRHSSSCSRRKRKEERRKRKKRSRSDSHHKHRLRRAEPHSPDWTPTAIDNRSEDHGKSGCGDGTHPPGDLRRSLEWGSAVKLANKIPSKCCNMLPECSVGLSRPGLESLSKAGDGQASLSNQGKGHPDYDSGNDTSSPPSTKTGISRAKAVGKAASPEKLRFTDRDNASDSGNSLTSYHSAGKTALSKSTLSGSAFKKIKREERNLRLQPAGRGSARSFSPNNSRYRSESRSRSRSRSSRSSRHWGRYSRSKSLSSSRRSYSRLSSYSRDSRRGSVCSVGSRRSLKHSRYTPDRTRERKRGSGSSENQSKRRRKSRRRRASTPLRKRRRDSPSHLEARRITSARKRPIPYYRPSPSSSSSCSSLSSWSLFSLNRSPTRSRSRSQSRSCSRSSSWNSLYSRSRSRSRSYDSLASYSRARR
uniref:Serine/arginine repetitive matrix 4 n=1 Tax=Astyanax mexicanus TaxID=7994 RepID=A0A3B1IT70_ASTMX